LAEQKVVLTAEKLVNWKVDQKADWTVALKGNSMV
jgi:hypothetical protein